MTSFGGLQRSIQPREWLAWLVATLLLGAAIGVNLAGTFPSARFDRALILGGLAALAVPLRSLAALNPPVRGPLRRSLGETAASIIGSAATECLRLAGLTALATTVGAVAAVGLSAGASGAAANAGIPPVFAALFSCLAMASASVTAIWLTLGALEAMAGGLNPAWSNMTGGGAFGPAETAPLLYAPPVGYALGLVPAAIGSAAINALAGRESGGLTVVIGLGAALVVMLVVVVLGCRRTLARRHIWARRAVLVLEQAHQMAFTRSEHIGSTPSWLLVAGNTPAQRLLADVWHRRFPASGIATVALCVAASLGMRGSTSPVAALVAAFAITVYSGARAFDLGAAEPQALPTLRFLGAADVERAQKGLVWGLSVPSIAVVLFAWSSGAPLACAAGVVVGLLTLAGLRLPTAALIGKISLLAAVITIAAAPGLTA